MAGKVVLSDCLAKPRLKQGVIDTIIINPIFGSGIIRRVYVDTFYPSSILREQGFKGEEVIPLYYEIITGKTGR
jgi:hypothetical protein